MCYDLKAQPPYPPVSGGSSTGREFSLTAADGNEFALFEAIPETPATKGVVILPDVRGLHAFYQELALRFAELGIHAVAIDYFGRTAGRGPRGDDFEFMPHVMQCQPRTLYQDIEVAVQHLRSKGIGSIFSVGFCFGGRLSFNLAAERDDLAGVIGFYGRPTPRDESDDNAPIDKLDRISAPVLGLFGGDDRGIPAEDIEKFRHALDERELQNEIVIYEGAPHSFFDRTFDKFKNECDDAWRRIIAFIH